MTVERLATLQAEQTEVGRIRMGTSTPKVARSGKAFNEPVKLERFRLTSKAKPLIEAAARTYGGSVEPWEPQSGGARQWQVFIEADGVAIMLAPSRPLSQWFIQRVDRRVTRRCNGEFEQMSAGECLCGPDPTRRVCKPVSWLRVMLIDLPGIGYWRLESHGYNAARELPAMVQFLARFGDTPALLAMEEEQSEVPDPRKPGELMTARYMVPKIHVQLTPRQLLQQGNGSGLSLPSAPPAQPAAVTAQVTARPGLPSPEQHLTGPIRAAARPELPAAPAAPTPPAVGDLVFDIAAATTRERMMALREQAQGLGVWPKLQQMWTERAHELVRLEKQQQADGPPPPQSTPPRLDRNTLWSQVVAAAGALGESNTELDAALTRAFPGVDKWDLSAADLQRFLIDGFGPVAA